MKQFIDRIGLSSSGGTLTVIFIVGFLGLAIATGGNLFSHASILSFFTYLCIPILIGLSQMAVLAVGQLNLAIGAMGGVETSAADYAKWVAFLLSAWPARDGPETGPVKRATVREIATPGATAARIASVRWYASANAGSTRIKRSRDSSPARSSRRASASRPSPSASGSTTRTHARNAAQSAVTTRPQPRAARSAAVAVRATARRPASAAATNVAAPTGESACAKPAPTEARPQPTAPRRRTLQSVEVAPLTHRSENHGFAAGTPARIPRAGPPGPP